MTSRPRKKRPLTIRYGSGSYRPAPNGRGYDCTLTLGGIRHRLRVPDEPAARAWIDSHTAAPSRHPLTSHQLLDARAALALLPPGASLLELARAHLAHTEIQTTTTLHSAIQLYLRARAPHLRSHTLVGYRQLLTRLSRTLPSDALLSSLDSNTIATLLNGVSPHTRNTCLRAWSAFFNWCISQQLRQLNPCARLQLARAPEPPKGILTPDQVRTLLHTTQVRAPHLLPYLPLAFFTGIRPTELQRLQPHHFHPEYILLDGAATKTATVRTIPISANLHQWLLRYPPRYPLQTLSRKHHYLAIKKLSQASDLPTWPKNCARHSYATYRYELTRDAHLVASELGHTGTAIFIRHYRALAHPGTGTTYFNILPTN